MKNSFLFSRRFWLPFLLMFIVHLGWFAWEFGKLYAADFRGKGLPSELFRRWLWYSVNGPMLYVSFLTAFLLGITWHSHFQTRKNRYSFHPFSGGQLLSLFAVMLAVFYYTAYTAPGIIKKSRRLLTEVVFAHTYDQFKEGIRQNDTSFVYSESSLTLTQLYDRKKKLGVRTIDEFDIAGKRFPLDRSLLKVRLEIAKRFTVPVIILLFYCSGIFMGFSFYKTYRLIPFFLSWLLVALGWYILDTFLVHLYRKGDTALFIGAWGPALSITILIFSWYLALRRYGFFSRKEEGIPEDFLAE